MDELIVRLLRGETSDIESRQIERWRAATPENERLFQEIRAVWVATAPDRAGVAPSPAPVTLVERAEARRRNARARARRWSLVRSPWPAYGLAAAAVAALALFVTTRVPNAPPESPRLAPVESASGASDVVTMSLSDGSVVRLAASTSVEFPPDPDARSVRLEGRAFFAVAPSDRPFVVHTRDGTVTVHGTRFEVRQDGDGLRVVVVEGAVAVDGPGGSARLEPGQVAELSAGGAPVVRTEADPWALLRWDGGLLVFQSTPLTAVASELSRHFGRPVRVADPAAAGRRITAWFGDEPLDEVVAAVCLVAGAACQPVGESGDVVIGR